MKKAVRFNEKIAREVFAILDELYRNSVGIFKANTLPQNRWIPTEEKPLSEKEIVDFLFYASLLMRGGIVSDDPFKLLWILREKNPEMFKSEIVAEKSSEAQIKEKLNEVGLKFKDKQTSKSWLQNSQNLHQWWGNDIRNVFKHGVSEFEEAFRRVDYERSKTGFYGMRRKIFSLLTIWLQEKKLIPMFPTPIPVDFHALRILWATEIINLNNWTRPFIPKEKHPKQLTGKPTIRIQQNLTDQIAIWSQKFLQKHGILHLTINPALWILSRSLCAGQIQNLAKDDAKTYIETKELKRNPNLWPKNYSDPCHICPIEKWCKWCIPAAPYYRWGLLLRIGKRVPYPQPHLFGFENLNHKPRKKNRGAD